MRKSDGIPPGKKRYTVTLTQSKMEGIQAYFEKNKIPKSMVSNMLDELIGDVLRTMQELQSAQERQGKPVGIGDLLKVMGGIMTDKTDDQGRLL
jgi:hypothetical protein